MAPDPGPLDTLTSALLAPFPVAQSFEGLVADRLGDLVGSTSALDAAGLAVVANPPDDLDGTFSATIGAAESAAADEAAGAPPSAILEYLDAGDSADSVRVDSERYLPGSDAPIEQTFDPPPPLPSDVLEPGPPKPEPPPVN